MNLFEPGAIYRETANAVADALCYEAAKLHTMETRHETAVRSGEGWLCSECDADDYDAWVRGGEAPDFLNAPIGTPP